MRFLQYAPMNANISNETKRPIINAFYVAIAAAVFLAGLKVWVFYTSNSTAVLASLADSIVDVVISCILLAAVRYSFKPADNDHRYGHGKMEGVASLFQAAVMLAAGLFVIFESIERFIDPVIVQNHLSAIIVLIISVGVSIFVMQVQNRALAQSKSFILEADSAHYKTDIFLNGSVVIALLINFYDGPKWIDPFIAFCIASYFLATAYTISKRSIDMLMDREVCPDTRDHIEKIALQHDRILGMHDLRTRNCGKHIHISFDVELQSDLTLKAAHDIVRELDQKILQAYPNAEVIIHMDPEGDTDDPRHLISGVNAIGQ